jgi:hypothetical protein
MPSDTSNTPLVDTQVQSLKIMHNKSLGEVVPNEFDMWF